MINNTKDYSHVPNIIGGVIKGGGCFEKNSLSGGGALIKWGVDEKGPKKG